MIRLTPCGISFTPWNIPIFLIPRGRSLLFHGARVWLATFPPLMLILYETSLWLDKYVSRMHTDAYENNVEHRR